MTDARRQLIEAAVREIDAGGEDALGTFAVIDDADRWLQYVPGAINAAYPHSDEPAIRLAALGYDEILVWEANAFVSLDIVRDPRDLAKWIDRYFTEILSAPGGFSLNWTREQ